MVSKANFKVGTLDEKRREIIMNSYRKAIALGDKNVYFVDGIHIYDGEYSDSCTVDGIHPNDFGFYRMALAIGKTIDEILKKMSGENNV